MAVASILDSPLKLIDMVGLFLESLKSACYVNQKLERKTSDAKLAKANREFEIL